MTDFADAFNRGQSAAVRAAQARAEIDAVFTSASTQLSEITQGRLELGRHDFDVVKAAGRWLVGESIESLLGPKEREPWVAARNPKAVDSGWVKLARWDRPREGYPCALKYENREVRCHDEEALTNAIAELLASAWGGERLHALLSRPVRQEGHSEDA
ncbi:hypothetical protein N5J06_20085 [Ralstonia sp. CHL-2022]|uniref:Uncharacterized protein n=1 Tax=Ralstonia mojiangensis TaxID=2953895 RepID=A0ABT2LD92_9RALS|nr:hypothetical protein [Ralstonia mojiangensis]MCT7313280.1 hypothetical protein [Ralstonia mojiangensis]